MGGSVSENARLLGMWPKTIYFRLCNVRFPSPGKIRIVNAVSPGVVRTNLWQNMQEHEREGMYESLGKILLVGHVGGACEIARAYLFLMHEGYTTGQTVVVDGGAVLV